MEQFGIKPMAFPPGSSGNGMVDGASRDWERQPDRDENRKVYPGIHETVNRFFSSLIVKPPWNQALSFSRPAHIHNLKMDWTDILTEYVNDLQEKVEENEFRYITACQEIKRLKERLNPEG